MSGVDIATVWPHANGIVRVAYSPDAKLIYSSGSEGFVRYYEREDTEAAQVIDYHAEPVNAISVSRDYVCSADDMGQVALHNINSTEFKTLLNRTNLPARDVAFDPTGRYVAVVSDELVASVIDVNDTLKIKILSGHKKGLLSASWSPDSILLVTTSSDGQIRVWDLSEKEPNCIQIIDGLLPTVDPMSDTARPCISWHPSGKYFVCANRSNELVQVSRSTWQKTVLPADPKTKSGTITALAFSASGTFLVFAAEERLHVYDIEKRKMVSVFDHPRPSEPEAANKIHGIACNPIAGSRDIAYTDDRGQIMFWTNALPEHQAKAPAAVPAPAAARSRTRSVSAAPAKAAKKSHERAPSHRSDTIDIDDLDPDKSKRSARDNSLGLDEPEEPWLEDDLGDGFADALNDDQQSPSREKTSYYGGKSAFGRVGGFSFGKSAEAKAVQNPLQPGSTEWRERRRYLAFNMLGYIHAVEREDTNIVTVEYHDRSARAGTHFNDHYKFSLAALGESGSAFACKSTGSQKSLVHFKAAEAWSSSNDDWTYQLPEGENVTALAFGSMPEESPTMVSIAGSGTVVVGTDRGYLRFLSGSGMQKYLVSIGYEIISIACARDSTFVVHRNGSTNGLDFKVFDNDTFELVQNGGVPVLDGVWVKWIGFSDEGIPVMYDSNNVLSLLDRARRPRQGRWVPVLDTNTMARRVGKQESYWPVGVSPQYFHALILKGDEKEPHFPTPLLQELELQLPLLRLDDAQGKLEETWLRETLFLSHRKDGIAADDYVARANIAQSEIATDKHLILILHAACKAERLSTALDAALLLAQQPSVDASIKVAAFFGLNDLEERLQLVKEAREGLTAAELENRRLAKWAHLVDDRSIVEMPRSQPVDASTSYSTNPFAATTSKKSKKAAVAAALHEATASRKRHASPEYDDQGGAAEDDSMYYDADEPEAKRLRSDSQEYVEADESMTKPAPAPAKSHNPFAKRPHVQKPDPPASSSNPFASKAANGSKDGKKKATDLTRTGSFFTRVENASATGNTGKLGRKNSSKENEGKKASSGRGSSNKKAEPATKQATLFGVANFTKEVVKKAKPIAAAAAAAADDDDDAEHEREGDETVDSPQHMDDIQETPLEDSQEGETQMETQVEETQAETESHENLADLAPIAMTA